MRCKSCDYLLWNLTARQCPECGASFRPSEYEFAPRSVRFQCPRCDQVYYGTDDKGLLVPRAFQCVSCHQGIDLDDMVLRPAKGFTETETRLGDMPWLGRRRRGRFKSFFATVGMTLVNPGQVMRGTPRDSSVGEALLFGILVLGGTLALGGVLPSVAYSIWYWHFWGEDFWEMLMGVGWSVTALCALVGLIPAWALVTHAVLRVTGGCSYPVDRTIVAMAYSAGAHALGGIPLIGPFIGWIWWVTSATIMVREGQRVGGGRAAIAVLAFPLTLAVLAASVPTVAMYWQYGMPGFTGQTGQTRGPDVSSTLSMVAWLSEFGWSNDGLGPDHALELCTGVNSVMAYWAYYSSPGITPFCFPGTKTSLAGIPVGTGSLEEFLALPASDQIRRAADVLMELPEGIIAHRFGDFIFVHHGADLGREGPELWTLVMLPDPTVNGPPAAGDPVHIGANDQTVSEITFGELAEALTQQNAYRATIGLPPLPDLTTVTHEKPAVASPKKE